MVDSISKHRKVHSSPCNICSTMIGRTCPPSIFGVYFSMGLTFCMMPVVVFPLLQTAHPVTSIKSTVAVQWVNRSTAQPATVVWVNKTRAPTTVQQETSAVESPTTPSIIPTTVLTTISSTTVSKESLLPDTTGAATPKRVNIGSEHLLWFGKYHFVESILSDCL